MNFRLRTSQDTEQKLKQLQNATGLTPNVLARISVCLSLKTKKVMKDTKVKNAGGIEFNRNTLTGRHDFIFKSLIAQVEGREISDEEFFPDLFNSHLENGIDLLMQEYSFAGNYEKLITYLISQ